MTPFPPGYFLFIYALKLLELQTKTAGEIAFDNAMEAFREEERRHIRRLKIIRHQGYAMQSLIIAIVLFFIFAPLFIR